MEGNLIDGLNLFYDQENNQGNLVDGFKIFFDRKKVAVKLRIAELEEKIGDISYDGVGKLSGTLEGSEYFSDANKSADFFSVFIINTDIPKLRDETKRLRAKKEIERKSLLVAKDLLKSEKIKLKLIDKEIYDIDVEFLGADSDTMKILGERLETKRIIKDAQLSKVLYLDNEIYQLGRSINNIDANIAVNKETIDELKEKLMEIKNKKDSDYFYYDKLNKDMEELTQLKSALSFMNTFGEKQQIVMDKEKSTHVLEEPEKKDGFQEDRVDKVAEKIEEEKQKEAVSPQLKSENKEIIIRPFNLPSVIEQPKEELNDLNKVEVPQANPFQSLPKKEKTMDGFTLDFIEKFSYVPGEREKKLNINYNGDTSRLVSNEQEAYHKNNSWEVERDSIKLAKEESLNEQRRLRKGQIIVEIRSVSIEIMNSIRSFLYKDFVRRPDSNKFEPQVMYK